MTETNSLNDGNSLTRCMVPACEVTTLHTPNIVQCFGQFYLNKAEKLNGSKGKFCWDGDICRMT